MRLAKIEHGENRERDDERDDADPVSVDDCGRGRDKGKRDKKRAENRDNAAPDEPAPIACACVFKYFCGQRVAIREEPLLAPDDERRRNDEKGADEGDYDVRQFPPLSARKPVA